MTLTRLTGDDLLAADPGFAEWAEMVDRQLAAAFDEIDVLTSEIEVSGPWRYGYNDGDEVL